MTRRDGSPQVRRFSILTSPWLVIPGYFAVIVLAAAVPGLGLIGQMAVLILATGAVMSVVFSRIRGRRDITSFLVVPTLMAAFENVYLLPFVDGLDPTQVRVLIVLDFGYSLVLAAVLVVASWRSDDLHNRKFARGVLFVALGLTIWSVVLTLLMGGEVVAAAASYRNLISPLLFLLVGVFAAPYVRVPTYLKALCVVGLIVILSGMVELAYPNIWSYTDLEVLVLKKGLPIDYTTGMPSNFYSSEMINGNIIRRMASTFADPVNLGTFLFVIAVAAWYLRRWLILALATAAAVLTVSKGALLSGLIAVVVWARCLGSRLVFYATLVASTACAVGFFVYQRTGSTGSTAIHIQGFIAAFEELPGHPWGRGLGSTGVLGDLFGNAPDPTASAITESGIGLIVGQLGVVGIAVYLAGLIILVRACRRLPRRERALGLILLMAITGNAMFNEVALSPRGSAPYWLVIGCLLGASPRMIAKHRSAPRRAGGETADAPLGPESPGPSQDDGGMESLKG